ncbi:MAG: hypothetical protein K2L42_00100 [Clostridia bacterium]|nr:hypothetical protein [Clostridia bacterium]
MKKKTAIIALLSVFAASSAGAALMTGCNATVGRIDAPTSLEEDLGTYVIPDYDVVDENGMILAGYNVYLKSVKNSAGEALDINYGSVTVDTAGVYSFVYSAGSKKVNDVTVSIDFADRTAPVINYDDRELPDFFIRGNEYRMPQYTLSGDFVREKCWAKVYYIAEDKTEEEVKIESGRFLVDKTNGSYAIRIHVEDAVGNANDYEYVRKVDGPETLVENRVLYFNEAFGARQVSCYDSAYKGEYVTDLPKVKENEADPKEEGAYKVTFDGVTQTRYNEGIISMNVPALINLYEYECLEMWVYNDSGKDIIMGSMWWNDTKIENGKWNKITWSTRDWGGRDGNKDATNTKFISVTDISKMTIRFIFDYDQKVIPNGTFYLSSMNAVPKTPATVKEVECATQGGGVSFDQSRYFINDTVTLSAKKVEGKVVDCYKVDGKVIAGNSFVVTKASHEVEAVYTDDPLTAEGMTWADYDYVAPVGSDAQVYKLGEGKNWVLSYDVYGVGASGWNYFAAYVGGTSQLLGFELVNGSGKFCGYGGSYKWGDGVALSSDMVALLRGATEQKPAKVIHIRDGNYVKTFVEYDGVSYFIATVDLVNTLECSSGDSFGIGGRAQPSNVVLHNIKAVATETKTELVHAAYAATVVKGDEVIDFANRNYRVGDTVTLSAPKESNGKLFLCFRVGDTNIYGNKFVITDKNVTVYAVYADPCTITLADGLTIDGKGGTVVVPAGKSVEIIYTGKSPDGKYYAGIFINGEEYTGGLITVTADISITVKYEDRVANDNEELNDISKAEESGSLKYHESQNAWRPSSVEYVTDFGYDGIDGTVDANNSLKVTLSGAEQAFALVNGIDNINNYSEIYFYVYSEKSGISVGGWWCRDVVTVAGKWIKVSFNREKAPQNISEKNVWLEGLQEFVYSFNGAKSGDVVYVTAVYGVPYEQLTTVTVEDGVSVSNAKVSADGTYTVGRGTTLMLTHEEKTDKIFDYYLVDDSIRVYTETFVATAATHNIKVVYVDSVDKITWVNGGTDYNYETVMGADASNWKSWNFQGEVYGSAQYWAVSVNVKHTTEWNSFEFIQGTKQSLRIRFHQANYFGVMVHDNNEEKYPSSEFVPAYPTQNAEMVAKLTAGCTITCVRTGGTIALYANGIKFFTTNYAIDHTGDWFGVGFAPSENENKPSLTDTEFIAGKDKVEAYLGKLQSLTEKTGEAQINNVFGAVTKDGSSAEYITKDVPAGLTDENFKEKGVLKVTAASNDIGLSAGLTFDSDASKFSEIYFWVYIESGQEEELKNVAGGAYWNDVGNVAKTNTWTKITFDATQIAALDGSAKTDLSQFTFRVHGQEWIAGYTNMTGKTFYITSLYGVPKA